jgi:hypothetical protein
MTYWLQTEKYERYCLYLNDISYYFLSGILEEFGENSRGRINHLNVLLNQLFQKRNEGISVDIKEEEEILIEVTFIVILPFRFPKNIFFALWPCQMNISYGDRIFWYNMN